MISFENETRFFPLTNVFIILFFFYNNQSILILEILHRYPPASPSDDVASGVPLTGDVAVARGTNGEPGSGVYSVDLEGETSGAKVVDLLAGFREKGVVEKYWTHTEKEFKKITGVEAV